MGSYTLEKGEKADGTSKIFFIGSDGQLVEGEFRGLPSLAETQAMCMSASWSVSLTPAAQEFFRSMEKAYAELERERQRKKAMRRAETLHRKLPKASPSKPRARF